MKTTAGLVLTTFGYTSRRALSPSTVLRSLCRRLDYVRRWIWSRGFGCFDAIVRYR